jgi:hypothetical protein
VSKATFPFEYARETKPSDTWFGRVFRGWREKRQFSEPEMLANPVIDCHDFQGMAERCESALPQTFTRCVKIGMIFTGWRKIVSPRTSDFSEPCQNRHDFQRVAEKCERSILVALGFCRPQKTRGGKHTKNSGELSFRNIEGFTRLYLPWLSPGVESSGVYRWIHPVPPCEATCLCGPAPGEQHGRTTGTRRVADAIPSKKWGSGLG